MPVSNIKTQSKFLSKCFFILESLSQLVRLTITRYGVTF
ncbi:hypothetical protein RG47T_1395 [Mucilaginibacter polytrichastri]|uniref:Uncharacterized protein n=1 Tax=Mucilaginibacter polytrichastri TaxID=1302689 RepID=A0A1Q5ZW67_9SPHI|nr:hypothetical protein RG47T_1395 [Mucilaginibacter polytrichastri]